MSADSKKSNSNGCENSLTSEQQQEKINEVRKLVGALPDKLSLFCSDASISRYLRARNWNIKKATKMLKETIKWRLTYKPEEIRWDEVAREAETGKIYRLNYVDKHGRTILVMRPGFENSKSTKARIKYLVYCMENAILNLPQDQEQMVWLIDFQGFNLSNISVKVTHETANVLQNHYPERLGLAILYNPPKFFEPFWKIVKPFLEAKTANKVNFVYSDDPSTTKIVEEHFDMDQLDSAFGGKANAGFEIGKYAERMREDDKKIPAFWGKGNAPEATIATTQPASTTTIAGPNATNSDSESDASDEKADKSLLLESDAEDITPDDLPVSESRNNDSKDVN